MALEISGADGLFWKAGIDTSSLEQDMKKIEAAVLQSSQKQAQAQEQVLKVIKQSSRGFDGMADSIKAALGGKTGSIIDTITGKLQTLQATVAGAGGGVKPFDAKALGVDQFIAEINRAKESASVQINTKVSLGSFNDKLAAFDDLKKKYAELSEIDRNSDIGKGILSDMHQLQGEIDEISKSFQAAAKHAAGSLDAKVANLTKLKAEYAALSETDRKSDIGKNLAKNIRGADKEIKKINKEIEQTNTLAQKAAVALGAYMSLQSIKGFVSDMVRVRSEFAALETSFQVLLKNKEKADQLMKELTELAATTPFSLSDVGAGAKQLLALGVEASKVTDLLRRMGDIAAGGGVAIDRIIRAYGQVKSLGRVRNEELLQLAEAGIPIYKELATVLGVAEDKVGALVNSGTVGFDKLHKVIVNLTDSGGMFAGMMESQSKALGGQLANLRDSWAQMLNDLGKSNEGVLSGSIGIAKTLIDNYETVIDVIKVVAVTYGSYRAALLLTTVSSNALGKSTKALTALQILQTGVTAACQRVWALLNKTLLANPFVAVAAGLTALISAMLIFRDKTVDVKDAQELLSEAQKDFGDRLADARVKIAPYIEALKKANLSEEERVKIYNKLKEIDPSIVRGLEAKTLTYASLKRNVDGYLASLRESMRLEASDSAARGSIKQEQEIEDTINKLREKLVKVQTDYEKVENTANTMARAAISSNITQIRAQIKTYEGLLEEQRAVTRKFLEGDEATTFYMPTDVTRPTKTPRTLEQIDAEIAELKKRQTAESKSNADYISFQKQIIALEEERKRITGATAKELKAQHSQEERLNSILDQRKSILEQIEALQSGARQSRMTRQQAEIEQINEKYRKVIDSVTEYNNKVAEFNKKNPKANAQGIGQNVINALGDARSRELNNVDQKAQVEAFQKVLDEQQRIYEQYEDTKTQIGARKANEMYAEQIKGFETYTDYLESEAKKIAPSIVVGMATDGDWAKMLSISGKLKEESEKRNEEERKRVIELYNLSASYNDKLELLERSRLSDITLLQRRYSGEELQQRISAANSFYEDQKNQLREQLISLSPLYRQLGENLIEFNRDKLKQRLKELQQILKDGFTELNKGDGQIEPIKLTPQMIEDIQAGIAKTKDLLAKTDKILGLNVEKWEEIAQKAGQVASIFSTLSDTFTPINGDLGDMLSQLGEAANITGNVASGFAQMTTNPLGAAQSFASALQGVVQVFVDAKKTADEARKAVQDFYQAIQVGEIQTAIAIRERLLMEAQLKDLTLDRLKAEKDQLDENRKANEDQYNLLLKQLQKEQYIADQRTKKGKGSVLFGAVGWALGVGAKTKVEQELASLAGMTYDQIEKLFNNGQLTESATQLFQQLQKLKEEGVDIDRQLQELKRESQEIYTGTTSDNISRMIRDGFGEGLRSVEQFGDKTEDIIRNALLNGLEYGVIQKQVQALYEQFAADAESGGGLDLGEIENFTNSINKVITDSAKFAEMLEKQTGISLSKATSEAGRGNSLAGAISGIRADQADILAGAMNAQRMTALEQLNVARQKLDQLRRIEANTFRTAVSNEQVYNILQQIKLNGLKVI